MNTFIRVAEVWVPSSDGTVLELASGWYEQAPAFGASSKGMCFGRAEGLPGRAWDEGRPLLLRQLEGAYFRRAAQAQASGLTCAVALPFFQGEAVSCVLVLLCGSPQSLVGALELWHNNPRVTGDLTLADGFFGEGALAFEEVSRDAYLPRGSGLPGLAWQRQEALFVPRLDESPRFLRADAAAQAGIVRGLAIPCDSIDGQTWVLSLLSSEATPLARRVERWVPDGEGLRRCTGYDESLGPLPELRADPAVLGAVGRAWRSGVAQADTGVLATGDAHAAGLTAVIAVPLRSDGAIGEVLALRY